MLISLGNSLQATLESFTEMGYATLVYYEKPTRAIFTPTTKKPINGFKYLSHACLPIGNTNIHQGFIEYITLNLKLLFDNQINQVINFINSPEGGRQIAKGLQKIQKLNESRPRLIKIYPGVNPHNLSRTN